MKSTSRAGQKPAGPRGAPAGRPRTPAGRAGSAARSAARSPADSTRPPAAKARGAKGHFFTGPATPAGNAAQRTRTAAATGWDDDDDDDGGIEQSGTPARGAKVRSRRPTGAQELRAMRLRDDSRHKELQRGAAGAAVRTAGAAGKATNKTSGHATAAPANAAAARSAPPAVEFRLTGDYIALDNLLKLTGTASSGGAAKALAAEGAVKVDGKVELRKTCKIRAGQLVQTGAVRIRVLAPAA